MIRDLTRNALSCLGLFLILAAPQAHLRAEVQLPNVFGDHMVLQQGQENPVWGRAAPGEDVTVRIAGQSHQTRAGADGTWRVMLGPLAAGGPHELTIEGENMIEFADVLVGEVWVCSGQSNMQWTVDRSNDPDLERAAAHFPQIRMINFPQVGSQEPIWSHDRQWKVCTPENVGDFSAVGYFFARQLHQTLQVPVGMINNAWGGSAAEAWVGREVLREDGRFEGLLDRWEQMEQEYSELSAKKDLSEEERNRLRGLERQMGGNHRPGNIYNGVLTSHLGYGIRGTIWYQGESNAGRAYQYRDLFPLMISTWRDQWGQADFPFYWVQLADFMAESPEPEESAWAELREAQTMTMDKLPNTGQAVIIDIGEGKDIHPKNKVDVARRLARWALAKQYGLDIPYHSPEYESHTQQENKIVLEFDHVGAGWRPFDVREPRGFTVAGEDRKFVPASARILQDGRVEVWNESVENPIAVRYGWANNPVVNMYNQAGLPLTPFRTDEWQGVTQGVQ